MELAEAAFAGASQDEPGWVGRLASPARLYAATGHALAELYAAAGAEGDRREAARRLGRAVEEFDPGTHTRAYALCVARLARLHPAGAGPDGDAGTAGRAGRVLPPAGAGVRSARVAAAAGTARPGTAAGPPAAGSGQEPTGATG